MDSKDLSLTLQVPSDMELRDAYVQIILISTALCIIFLRLRRYCRWKLSYWERRGVEQLSTSHWFFGDYKEGILFQSAPGWHLGQIYKKTKPNTPFVGFYIFHKPYLLLKDPEIIKQILIKDFDKFTNRNFAGELQKDSYGMKNLFGLRNPAWRYLRKKVTPTFTKSKIKQMLPFMMETGEQMMKYIEMQKGVKDGVKIVDAQELNYKYSADMSANVALGTKMDSFNHPNAKFIQTAIDNSHCFKRKLCLFLLFFVPELTDFIGSPFFVSSEYLIDIFWDVVRQREKTGEKRGDYIDSVIKLKNEKQNSVYKLEGDNLFFQSGTFFAGFESSSIAAAFALMELARHKDFQDRAREEIKNAVEKYGWTDEAYKEMKYLEQCILESIRLHPSLSYLDRVAEEDYQIPNTDVIIEKGTAIYISLHGLHEDTKYFEEPEVYNPERFSEDRTVPDAYMPFGTGPRMCVGFKAGLLHAKVVISLILSQYEIYPRFGEHLELDSRFVFTAAARGLDMEFRQLDKGELRNMRPGSL